MGRPRGVRIWQMMAYGISHHSRGGYGGKELSRRKNYMYSYSLSLCVLDLIYQQPHRSTHSHMPSLHYHTVPTSCVLRGLPSRTAYAIRGAVLSTAMTMSPLVRPSGSHTSGVRAASSRAG